MGRGSSLSSHPLKNTSGESFPEHIVMLRELPAGQVLEKSHAQEDAHQARQGVSSCPQIALLPCMKSKHVPVP